MAIPYNCLSEKDLWSQLQGDPTNQSEHLQTCTACRNRLEQLKESLLQIDQVMDSEELQEFLCDTEHKQSTFHKSHRKLSDSVEAKHADTIDEVGEHSHGISISRYRILQSLSYGGQGQVYLAEDSQLNRKVAIKIAHYSITEDLISSELIIAEGELLAKLNHPQLAQVYDAGVEAGRPFLVMEYVEGQTLKDYICENSLSMKEIRRIIRDIAAAVEVIHECGILHLDLKPENVIVTPDAQCKVVDLGTSWLMSQSDREGARVIGGTVAYMSPEQSHGDFEKVGPWTDVFGLGALLFSLLTKCSTLPKQQNRDNFDGLWVRGPVELRKENYHAALKKICLKAISLEPENRFQTVAEFIQRFEISDHRRQAGYLFVSGLISCWLGSIHLLQFMPEATPSFSLQKHVAVAETSEKIVLSSDNSTEKFLQIRAVNLPSGPLHFCVWSERDGLRFFPSIRETSPVGDDELSLASQREGLPLTNSEQPYWIIVIAEEFKGPFGSPQLKETLAMHIEKSFDVLTLLSSNFYLLNTDQVREHHGRSYMPRVHEVRHQRIHNIHLVELDLGVTTQEKQPKTLNAG